MNKRKLGEKFRFVGNEHSIGKKLQSRDNYFKNLITELNRSNNPIIIGPFMMEVGFELLYWIPMVTRILENVENIDQRPIHIITRGGAHAWYPFSSHHHEIFNKIGSSDFLNMQKNRLKNFGHQKQSRLQAEEEMLLQQFFPGDSENFDVLHPMTMVRTMVDYWSGTVSPKWLENFTDYGKVTHHIRNNVNHTDLIAMKFYSRESLTNINAIDCCLQAIISGHKKSKFIDFVISEEIDDHKYFANENLSVDRFIAPRLETNLRDQSQVLSQAKLLIGTYGGFTYLAQYMGIPVIAWEEIAKLNRSQHLFTAEYFIKPLSGSSISLVNSKNCHSLFHD
jgi:hypothetical protein